MSIFSWFATKPKTVDDIFDKDNGLLVKAGNWIGNMHFTDQERAELTAKNISAAHKFVVDTLSENTDRSKARREIATFFVKFYAIMLFLAGMLFPFNPDWSRVWLELATSVSVGTMISAITVFFFGSYAIARHNETKK